MALERKNRIKEQTTTTGTGTVTLNGTPATGYLTFTGNVSDGATVRYLIETPDKTEWEVGEGVFTNSGTTLSRDTVFSSSNSGNLVNFSAGIKCASVMFTAEDGKELGNGWTPYGNVIPTRASADDPTYVLTFAGVDLTDKVSVGMKIKWTQNATVRYGFVTKISFSTDTTLTLYGGTDYNVDDTSTYAISDVYFSPQKAPFGFPLDPDKWSATVYYSDATSINSPVQNTLYNLGSFQLSLPLGKWEIFSKVGCFFESSSASYFRFMWVLSSSTSSQTYPDLVAHSGGRDSTTNFKRLEYTFNIIGRLSVSSKTTIYSLFYTPDTTVSSIALRGSDVKSIIRATISYL